jgi:hypothetical protein
MRRGDAVQRLARAEFARAAVLVLPLALAAARAFELLDVGQILCPTSGTLVPNRMMSRQHGRGNSRELRLQSIGPRLRESHTVNRSRHVDSQRRDADLKHHTGRSAGLDHV